jgi:hypothetical protein
VVAAPIAYPIAPDGTRRAPILYRRASLVPRHLRVGQWSLTAKLSDHTKEIGAGWRIVFDGGPEPGFGGPVDQVQFTLGSDSGDRSAPTITLSGQDDMHLLGEALAYPDPAHLATAQTVGYDVRTGPGGSVILAYIARNIGHLAIASRATAAFNSNITDTGVGTTVTGKARFSPLLDDVVRPAAEQSGVRVRILSTSSGARTLSIEEILDLSGKARFSIALGNLRWLKYTLAAPTATVVIGGGRGEEDAREFVIHQNAVQQTAWKRRIERFYDYRSASDSDGGVELNAGAAKALADASAVEQVEVMPVDTPRLQYGRDYRNGDKVKVEIGAGTGLTVPAVILETEITVERGRSGRLVRVQPKVGTLGARTGLRSQADIADLLLRVSRLERR